MLLSIAILMLSVLLTVLQFLRQSRYGLKVATGVALLLVCLSIFGVVEQSRDRSHDIAARDRYGTHIDWIATDAYIDLLNDPGTVAPSDVWAIAKIIPPESKLLRPVSDPQVVQSACSGHDGPAISALPEELAERLFRALERPDGSAYVDDEHKAGIDHLFYSGETEVQSPGSRIRIKLALDRGPKATSDYLGLSDLNGRVLVALIQTKQVVHPVLSSLELHLKTSAGPIHLSLPAPIKISQIQGEHAKISMPSQRYVGICVPENHFGTARG